MAWAGIMGGRVGQVQTHEGQAVLGETGGGGERVLDSEERSAASSE